jgi:hypothetical protein
MRTTSDCYGLRNSPHSLIDVGSKVHGYFFDNGPLEILDAIQIKPQRPMVLRSLARKRVTPSATIGKLALIAMTLAQTRVYSTLLIGARSAK